MELRIQDPSWQDSSYLLEEILEACKSAEAGGGTFAFASAGGIRMLLGDRQFTEFLERSKFELVIGIDAVTDTRSLDTLSQKQAELPKLSAWAFFDSSPHNNAIFHPKMAWFKSADKATWILGSGNLTAGGLRGNVEAFTVTETSLEEHEQLENRWRQWLGTHGGHILPLDHVDVRDRAKQNTGIELKEVIAKGLIQEILEEQESGEVAVVARTSPGNAVLIVQLPKASDRWNQANFSRDTFENFFGATPGKTYRVLLTHIEADGSRGIEEPRPGVVVRSRNYRFELKAAAGRDYPENGRPIVIFLRLATRTFRYHLMMPGDPDYLRIHSFLQANTIVLPGRMMRLQTDAQALATAWPACPLL